LAFLNWDEEKQLNFSFCEEGNRVGISDEYPWNACVCLSF